MGRLDAPSRPGLADAQLVQLVYEVLAKAKATSYLIDSSE